jgi:Tfp pilus assembly protein PilN
MPFYFFLTVVSTVAIIASVAYKYLEIKAKTQISNDDIMALQQELHQLKQRVQNVETIVAADGEKPLIDLDTDETQSTTAAPRKKQRS